MPPTLAVKNRKCCAYLFHCVAPPHHHNIQEFQSVVFLQMKSSAWSSPWNGCCWGEPAVVARHRRLSGQNCLAQNQPSTAALFLPSRHWAPRTLPSSAEAPRKPAHINPPFTLMQDHQAGSCLVNICMGDCLSIYHLLYSGIMLFQVILECCDQVQVCKIKQHAAGWREFSRNAKSIVSSYLVNRVSVAVCRQPSLSHYRVLSPTGVPNHHFSTVQTPCSDSITHNK